MSEKLTIATPEDGNRPLSYQALSHGIDEIRLGDMGITDAVWRGPHSELVALAVESSRGGRTMTPGITDSTRAATAGPSSTNCLAASWSG